MNHLEYVQGESARNMAFHMDCMDNLQKEANNTLTFLYVVISASFSGALKLFLDGKFPHLAFSLAFLCLYLAVLAICLVFGCMMAKPAAAPANEPKNLKLILPHTSEQIQNWELERLQERIQFNSDRNAATGSRLNLIRIYISLSPIFFIFVLGVASLE